MTKNYIIMPVLFLFFLIITSCIIGKSRYVNFIRNNSDVDTNLKLNGFYFTEFEMKQYHDGPSIKYIHPILLYEDGTVRVFMNFSAFPSVFTENRDDLKLNSFENATFHFLKFLNNYSGDKGIQPVGWGQYRVVNDTLLIKYFNHGPSNMGDRTLCESKNIILNDTSFVQLNLSCMKKYEIQERRIYKFKEYSPKPDSTNWTHELLE